MAVVGRGLGMMAAGFGGAYMYENQATVLDIVSGISKGVAYLPAPKKLPASQADLSSEIAAISALSDQVARLSAEVGRIVAGGYPRAGSDSSRGYGWVIGVPAAAAAGWLAMRLAGASLGDVAWVTQHAYKRAMAQVQTSITALQERLSAARQALQEQLDRVVAGQEASAREQAALRAQVSGVGEAQAQLRREMCEAHGALRDQVASVEEALGERVGDLGDQVAGVGGELGRVAAGVEALRGSVHRVEATLQAVEESQQYSRQGIQMLCGVVSDAMDASARNQPAVIELRPPSRPAASLMPTMALGGLSTDPAAAAAGASRGVLADLAKVQNLVSGPGAIPEAATKRLRGVGAAALSSPTR